MSIAAIDVSETTLAFAIDVFGEVNLPPQSVIHRQLGCYAPGILCVVEHAVLTFRRVNAGADIAAELGNTTEHEVAQSSPPTPSSDVAKWLK